MEDWENRSVLIVGVARQGLALARYLLGRGARLILNDQRSAGELAEEQQAMADLSASGPSLEWVFGGHPLNLLDGIDLVCVSGGVPLTIPLIIEARARGIRISNDSQIFLDSVPCKVIGITGSAGKTTTTTLVGRIAQAATETPKENKPYRKAWIGGNIGSPLISKVDEMHPDDLAVMELSSFQLELMNRSPQIAAILNITPNHLDRHGTMEAYTAAKANILAFQSSRDAAILGRDDPGAWSLAGKTRGKLWSFGLAELDGDQEGAFFHGETIYLRRRNAQLQDFPVMSRKLIALRGEHNLLNVLAACTIAAAAGLEVEAMRAGVNGFAGVKHRLEFVRKWGGADWYNDSIATAPERSMAAIRSFEEPLELLAGGRDKDLPWDDFAALVRRRVDHLILFGEAAGKILAALRLNGSERLTLTRCEGLKEAVQATAEIVQPGDVVLLSPGGTSYDEFKDFEERGLCFENWVKELP